MSDLRRGVLLGLTVPMALCLPLAALTLPFFPNLSLIGTFARIMEHAMPQLLMAGLLPILAVWILGARAIAAGCFILSLMTVVAFGAYHVSTTDPLAPDAEPDLKVVWLNAKFDNQQDPQEIADAIRESAPDVVMLGEAMQLGTIKTELAGLYPYQVGCIERCEVMMLSRIPFTSSAVFNPNSAWAERLIIVELDLPGQEMPVTLAAVHLVKPWYYGITEWEAYNVKKELSQFDGPLILAGDFNDAPWSRRLRFLRKETGLKPARTPVPTWPSAAGIFGVPIDHFLLRDGPELVSLSPWGIGLGSDHRGLIAEIALP